MKQWYFTTIEFPIPFQLGYTQMLFLSVWIGGSLKFLTNIRLFLPRGTVLFGFQNKQIKNNQISSLAFSTSFLPLSFLYPPHKEQQKMETFMAFSSFLLMSFPGGSVVKNPATQEMWVWSLGLEEPQRRKWQPTPVFLPEKSHRRRSLVGYSP